MKISLPHVRFQHTSPTCNTPTRYMNEHTFPDHVHGTTSTPTRHSDYHDLCAPSPFMLQLMNSFPIVPSTLFIVNKETGVRERVVHYRSESGQGNKWFDRIIAPNHNDHMLVQAHSTGTQQIKNKYTAESTKTATRQNGRSAECVVNVWTVSTCRTDQSIRTRTNITIGREAEEHESFTRHTFYRSA